jgi:nucleoside-diphosphate-sugar epimerase
MKHTVFGASGFIGRNLVARLVGDGHAVQTPSRDEIRAGAFDRDLGNAFYCIGSDHWRDLHDLVEANFLIAKTILDTCTFSSFVYLSSSRVYLGAAEGREDLPLALLPDDPGRLYNAAKMTAEAYCLAAGDKRIKVVRPSNVVGFAPTSVLLIPALIRDALIKKKMTFSIGRGSSKDYVGVDALVDFLITLCGPTPAQLYNFASQTNTTVWRIASKISELTGCEMEWMEGRPDICFPTISMKLTCEHFGVRADSFNPVDMLPDLVRQHMNLLGRS